MPELESFIKPFSNELRLLLFLCGVETEQVSFEQLNWTRFGVLARKHRIVGHLLKNAETKRILPVFVYEELKENQRINSAKALNSASEISKINQLLSQEKVAHLFFKGTVLSVEIYDDPGFRDFKDIDVLVCRKDVERVCRLLKGMGYELIEPSFFLTNRQKRENYSISHHYHLIQKEKKIQIELHWRLSNPHAYVPIPPEELLASPAFISLGDKNIPCLRDVENLVFLAAHGAIHQWYRLFWLIDFYKLIKKTEEEILKKAWDLSKSLNLDHAFLQAHELIHMLFGLEKANFMKGEVNSKLLVYVQQSIGKTELRARGTTGKLNFLYYRFLLKSDFRHVGEFLFRLRTHYTDWEIVRLPDRLFFLYYILRPLLLLYKGIRKKLKIKV